MFCAFTFHRLHLNSCNRVDMDCHFLYTSRHWNKTYGGMLEMSNIADYIFTLQEVHGLSSQEAKALFVDESKLRDDFAKSVITGNIFDTVGAVKDAANLAYVMADAMLEERKK